MSSIPSGDPRQDPQENLLCEVYYDMLWNAAYQHDLNKSAGQKQRKAFISHQVDPLDESEHEFGEDNLNDSEEDDPSPYSVFQSSSNSTEPKKPTKVFIPYQLWGDFPKATKQMIIDYNKKKRVPNQRPHFNGGNTKPKFTLGLLFSHRNFYSNHGT